MQLPALNDAVLFTFRDEVTGEWGCFVGDTSHQIHGYTTGRTALKATSKAIDALSGTANPATVRPLTEDLQRNILQEMKRPAQWPVGMTVNA